jgi:hypothetical protein
VRDVRALLVPALTKLLGHRNWWSPRPLRWLHECVGLSESAPTEQAQLERAPGGPPNLAMLRIRASGQPFNRDTSNTYAKEER